MQWLSEHYDLIFKIALAFSEFLAVLCLLLFPDNKGVSGIIAGIIKFLKSIVSKDQPVQ